jgi:hypothetical protein
MTNEDDRDRGVLSTADRQFIRSPEEYSRQGTYERRTAIHERTANAVLDYPLLVEFEEYDSVLDEVDRGLVDGLKAQIEFVYKMANEAGFHAEELIDDAVEEAKASRIDVLRRRFESDPESLTLGEYSDLYVAGELSEEAYQEVFYETIRQPIGRVDSEEDGVFDEVGGALGGESVNESENESEE